MPSPPVEEDEEEEEPEQDLEEKAAPGHEEVPVEQDGDDPMQGEAPEAEEQQHLQAEAHHGPPLADVQEIASSSESSQSTEESEDARPRTPPLYRDGRASPVRGPLPPGLLTATQQLRQYPRNLTHPEAIVEVQENGEIVRERDLGWDPSDYSTEPEDEDNVQHGLPGSIWQRERRRQKCLRIIRARRSEPVAWDRPPKLRERRLKLLRREGQIEQPSRATPELRCGRVLHSLRRPQRSSTNGWRATSNRRCESSQGKEDQAVASRETWHQRKGRCFAQAQATTTIANAVIDSECVCGANFAR